MPVLYRSQSLLARYSDDPGQGLDFLTVNGEHAAEEVNGIRRVSTSSDITRNTSYHHGNLRTALLERARIGLEAQGIEGLSLRALARELGVSQAAPYRHFSDKAALLGAVAAEGFRELKRAVATGQAAATASPLDRLGKSGRAYVQFALGNPELFRLMFGARDFHGPEEFEEDELHVEAQSAYNQLFEIIASGIRSGHIASANARATTLSCWAAVHGVATLLLDTVDHFWEAGEKEALIDDTLSLVRAGLTHPGGCD